MQHEQSKVSSLRRTERIRSARTPDRTDIRNIDMSTMSMSSPKRTTHTSRASMFNPSMNASSANLRKMELENNNLELELIYSEYVASYAQLFLEQKALKNAEVSFDNSIKKTQKETKSLLESCKLIETRTNDVKALSYLNDYLDSIQVMVNKFKEKEQLHKTQDLLKQLRQLLDRFSVLRCENIILPSSPEEVKQFKESLKRCSTLLNKINQVFKCDELENLAVDYREFLSMCKEISSVKKIVEKKICDQQSESLKSCSNILSQNEDDGNGSNFSH